MKHLYLFLVSFLLINMGCKPEDNSPTTTTTPYKLQVPSQFQTPNIPSSNPLTADKILLGRMLFYDKDMSEDNQVSCASCHKQEFAFGSDKKIDIKVNHGMTKRNSSTLFNLAYFDRFFWDGRKSDLENTCLDAMQGEQNFNVSFVSNKMYVHHPQYKDLFQKVFGTTTPSDQQVSMAIASFIRTMISGNSKIDKGIQQGNFAANLNPIELAGKEIFETEKGDCFHCHGDVAGNRLMTDNLFHNNGIDSFTFLSPPTDLGLMEFTKNQNDMGKFKTPPIRNLSYSAPYMHDGRFATLDDVLNHYNSNLKKSPTSDPNLAHSHPTGMNLLPSDLAKLKAFLLTFDDPQFIQDTSFRNPF